MEGGRDSAASHISPCPRGPPFGGGSYNSFHHHLQQQQQQQHQQHHHQQEQEEEQRLEGAGFHILRGSSMNMLHAPTAMRHGVHSHGHIRTLSNLNSTPNLNSDPVTSASDFNINITNPNSNNTSSSSFFREGEGAGAGNSGLVMSDFGGDRSPSSLEPAKRKRGRPRKYAKDANGVSILIPQSPRLLSASSFLKKKKNFSSGKKAQLLALGAAGQKFTPHVLTINAGEDVSTRIITFTSQGPWAVCILSANGAISNATLRHPGVSGGAVTYEGHFEILSLSGSFLLTECGGTRSRTGGLSVSLAGPDGRVMGGGVAGLLMAASPVQVVVGTFFTDNQKSVGSDEAVSAGKHPTLLSVGTSSFPTMQHTRMDGIEFMQDHMMGDAEQHSSRVYHILPLQSIDWGGNYEAEARGDTEPDST